MNSIKVFSTMCLCLVAFNILGQLDSKVTTGVVHYDMYEYEQAINKLNLALSDPTQLKSKNIPKAHYYRGMSYIAILREALLAADDNVLNKYHDGYLLAFRDFIRVTELGENKYVDKATSQLKILESSMLQAALTALSEAHGQTNPEEKKDGMKKSLEYALSVANYAGSYLAWDLTGQAQMGLGDSTSAHSSFDEAIHAYSSGKPDTPDAYMGYVYYRKALIERYGLNDSGMALSTTEAGIKMTEDERARYATNMPDDDTSTFEATLLDLYNFELDLYLNMHPVPDKAVSKFEAAIERDPTNYTVRVAFASMMESRDIDRAIALYEDAIALDPESYLAHYNLGALCVNEGVKIQQRAVSTTDNDEYESLMVQMREWMARALPHLEKAHEAVPTEMAIIEAILSVCLQLDDIDKYQIYKDKKDALN